MRTHFALLVLLLCTLFLSACSGASSQANPPSPAISSGLRVLLVPSTGAKALTETDWNAARTILLQRLTAFGLKNADVLELPSGGRSSLQVSVPHFGGDEHAMLKLLLEKGTVEFWMTGLNTVAVNSVFDPTQFPQDNPGNQPWFTGNDLDPSQVRVGSDEVGRPTVYFEMKKEAIPRFSHFTASHIDNYLVLTLDRTVVECAFMVGSIDGPAQITGDFTQQQAAALASVLKFSYLPATFHIEKETTF